MADNGEIRWGLAQRFEFLEWRAYWVGRVNRKDLEEEFQISTPQASVDLRNYQEAAPGNIEYNATEKTYVATDNFRPVFLKLSPERYLLQVQALTTGDLRKSDTWFDRVPPADAVPPIVRGPQAYTLRAVIRAIETRGSVSINYQSLTRTGVREICPHALAHDGFRWHARALSREHGEFRDYVLGRILSVSQITPCDINPSDDVEWTNKITLRLVAHPSLTSNQKSAIEHDYRFEKGALAIEMRLALAYYFIVRNNLDLRQQEISPNRAQLFLQNFDEFNAASQAAKEESKKLVATRRSRASARV
jgi:hypothetical protein